MICKDLNKYSDFQKKEKILFYCLSGFGDCIMMSPAIRALKDSFPNQKICIFTMNRQVNEFYSNSKFIDKRYFFNYKNSSLLKFLVYLFFLRKQKAKITIMGFPANRIHYMFVSLLVGGKKRLGHKYLLCNISSMNFLYTQKVIQEKTRHNVEENLELIKLLNPSLKTDRYNYLSLDLKKKNLHFSKEYLKKNYSVEKFIGIHAGCSAYKNHKNRRWPRENFRDLVKYFSRKGYQIILFGDRSEFVLNKYLIKDTSGILFFDDSILNTAAVIKQLDLFISNDSGLMHLATACDIFVLAIIGPTKKEKIAPFSSKSVILENLNYCRGCFEYSKNELKCKKYGDFRCIRQIKVEKVIQEVEKLLK